MRTKFLFSILVLSLTFNFFSNAQGPYYNEQPDFLKANSIWTFGEYAGLNFNTRSSISFLSQLKSNEGCAAVSDPVTGKLLFYSDGSKCWNANGVVMPNGDNLLGNIHSGTTAQGACIVPVLNSPGKYYLFSLDDDAPTTPYLYCSIIDMNLNNGLGDIESGKKNIVLNSSPLSEGMIAIPGDNCGDIWLMLHSREKPDFIAYHITKDGLDTVPVISSAGQSLQGKGAYNITTLAISPDRQKIALATSNGLQKTEFTNGILIATFNPTTGKVSNAMRFVSDISLNKSPYDICFSPDNSKLYASILFSTGNPPRVKSTGELYQFDLSTYDSVAIANSMTLIGTSTNVAGFRLYNDTIYVSRYNGLALDIISQPNLLGAACGFQIGSIPLLSGSKSILQLGNDVVYPLSFEEIYNLALDSAICEKDFILNAPSGYTKYQWEDGSTSAVRTIIKPGTYWVKSNEMCNLRVDTFIISGGMDLIHPVINVNELILGTDESYNSYQWMLNGNILTGEIDSTLTISENGDYQVAVSTKGACLDTSDVYKVTNVSSINDFNSLVEQIRVFPNPVQNLIYIKTPFKVNVLVTNMEGKILLQKESTNSVSIKHLADGIYLLRIMDSNGNLITVEKFIKQNSH